MFIKNARLAETAFEHLMESNHRHSKLRFEIACKRLQKLERVVMKKDGLQAIIERAIEAMEQELVSRVKVVH